MTLASRAFEEAVAMGRRNRETVELARRHCVHLEFRESELGGRGTGMAEAATGLPINTRRVQCTHAPPARSASSNLHWIASEFYRSNCVGCPHRKATGELPSLATVLEAEAAERAEEEINRLERVGLLREERDRRSEHRRALRVSAHAAMQGVLADLDSIDADPEAEPDVSATQAAMDRLAALAERAPETFSAEVLEHMAWLVEERRVLGLLLPLRLIARSLPHHRVRVVDVALTVLRDQAVVEASRCLLDSPSALEGRVLDERVVHSLVLLAGAPEADEFGRRGARSARNDPGGLRLIADREPEAVVAAVRRLLQRRPSPSELLLPPGLKPERSVAGPSEHDRCAAAGAVRGLSVSHPQLALALADDLIRAVRDDEDESYGLHPTADLQHTLAVLLATQGATAAEALERAGPAAAEEQRLRLFGALERAARLLDSNDRWREPEDPSLSDEGRQDLCLTLFRASLTRLTGDWGAQVAFHASCLVESLTEDAPDLVAGQTASLLGALLLTIDRLRADPVSRVVVPVDNTPPAIRQLEAASDRFTVAATGQRLTNAIGHLGEADPVGVLEAITATLRSATADRDESELPWRLLSVVGEIAARQGHQPNVLKAALPVLHTYLVHREPALRAAAIKAWTGISRRHATPASLKDLLPALLEDRYLVVIRAVLDAAGVLEWDEAERGLLLRYACSVLSGLQGSERDALKSAMWTSRILAANQRAAVEALVLKRAGELDGYDLRDVLQGDWLAESRESEAMAVLRLRLAWDPRIVDRLQGDDGEMADLLECAAGLGGLPWSDVRSAAMEWCPEHPHWSAEFAEVLWRAGRSAEAVELLEGLLSGTPRERTYEERRAVVACFLAAARLDAELAGGGEASVVASRAVDAVADALSWCKEGERPTELAEEVLLRVEARCLLSGTGYPPAAPGSRPGVRVLDPARGLRDRAAQLSVVGAKLAAAAARRTPTAAYLRGVAAAFEVAAHLLRFDAAELDASESRDAHLTAAKRRAAAAATELAAAFRECDPLGRPLVEALQSVAGVAAGTQVAPLLSGWTALPLPLLLVSGARDLRVHHPEGPAQPVEDQEGSRPPVVVVLAYIDGHLVTGPQVLRPSVVYTLRLEVRAGAWPGWAERLDAEVISHLNGAEAQVPSFSWHRSEIRDGALTGEGTLILRFGLSAGQPAPPFLVSLRFRGHENQQARQQACDVAGHREVRLRPFDASRDALTEFTMVDERLLLLYERLHGAGYDESQVQAFCRLLTAVCRVGLEMTWEKAYKRGAKVSEKEFHDDLHQRLLAEPALGGRVQRGQPLGLGFFDVRHDGITAELKVERRVPVTEASAPKYMGQPTQYAAADGARLSILCILDMSPKERPIGTPENYLWQTRPALHGLDNPEAPSLVTVLVVNGNLPSPSNWSRRPPGPSTTIA